MCERKTLGVSVFFFSKMGNGVGGGGLKPRTLSNWERRKLREKEGNGPVFLWGC